jgi:ribosomal protein S18 acetylase RimI-like enzyme
VAPSEPEMLPLDPTRDAAAATLLAAAGEETVGQAAMRLAAARADGSTIIARVAGDELFAVAFVQIDGLTAELPVIAVAPEHRRQGHGRACVDHALRLVGRRPLAVEIGESTLGFYRACGFKLIGKRRRPDGAVRYRLAAHARLPQTSAITLQRPSLPTTPADRPG